VTRHHLPQQDPIVAFASEMIRQALKDMHRIGSPFDSEVASAVVWLASKRATPYFDLTGLDQHYVLSAPRVAWRDHAEALLNSDADLTPAERKLLVVGIRHIDASTRS